ncbi:hypothetical protein ACQR1I_35430 [Bradyrhizobium sp. HKCCYLS2038]|uniref:hypothetical protein n=1 Tax=unclassified Bradyrhizobium TaxID=2631580 RepID=UPI003EBF01F6
MTDDDALMTLDEAAKLIPSADADTLKRMHRAGKLVCYKPGKKLLTTAANVVEAVKVNCRVTKATPPPANLPTNPLGLSSTELSGMRLDLELERLLTKGKAARANARPPRK